MVVEEGAGPRRDEGRPSPWCGRLWSLYECGWKRGSKNASRERIIARGGVYEVKQRRLRLCIVGLRPVFWVSGVGPGSRVRHLVRQAAAFLTHFHFLFYFGFP